MQFVVQKQAILSFGGQLKNRGKFSHRDANCLALSVIQRMGLNVFFINVVLAKGREYVSFRKKVKLINAILFFCQCRSIKLAFCKHLK